MESFGKLVLGTSQPPGTVGREGFPEGSPSLSISCTVSQRVGLYTISAFVGLPALRRILGLRSVVLSLWAEDTALLSEGGRFCFFHYVRNVVLLAAHTGRGRCMLVATATNPVVFPVLCGGDSAAVWVVWPPPALSKGGRTPHSWQGQQSHWVTGELCSSPGTRWAGVVQLLALQEQAVVATTGTCAECLGRENSLGGAAQRLAMNHHLPGEGLLRKEEHEAGWQKKPHKQNNKRKLFLIRTNSRGFRLLLLFCFLVFWLYWRTLKYWVTCFVLHKMF